MKNDHRWRKEIIYKRLVDLNERAQNDHQRKMIHISWSILIFVRNILLQFQLQFYCIFMTKRTKMDMIECQV